ncbi:MAG: glycosyltransferase family 2 protein [Gammaproteobacteria bacterium]|nr:glycosyltransferase family 2 protein [Gammaproteobacteria bacterium]
MIGDKRIVVVMPAYNAEKTLEKTYREISREVVDEVILVDDGSSDKTAELARSLKLNTIVHPRNRGYGGNQKSCYREACRLGADIVVMVHPDYQYSPRLIPVMAAMVASGHYDVTLGSRILGGQAMKGGMPAYKYVANRFLTFAQNLVLGAKLSEYHTGLRAFSRRVLETLPLEENSEDFVFDNEMLVQCIFFGFRIGEISCPTRYFEDASSINFKRSMRYGFEVLGTTGKYLLHRHRVKRFSIFDNNGRRLSIVNC